MHSWLIFGIVVFWIQANQVAPEEIPNVPTVFFSVHILVWLWISMSVFFVFMNVCVCDFGSWQALVGRQVAAEVIPNSPLNGLLNSSASPRALPNTNSPASQWNPVYALNWPLGHSSRDTTVEFLALHSHFCTALIQSFSIVCEWVCVSEFVCEGSSGCLANAIFCRNPTRRGAEVLLFQIPLQLRSSTPVLVSFQMFHWFHQDLKNEKQIALDRKSYFPRKMVIFSKNSFGGPNSL